MKKLFVVLTTIISSLLFTNCATIFKGSTDNIEFTSEPSEAKVYANEELLGTTPLKVNLISHKSYKIEFKKEGYDVSKAQLDYKVGSGWLLLDIAGGSSPLGLFVLVRKGYDLGEPLALFSLGLIPLAIDALTGNWNVFERNKINAILEKTK